MINRVGQVYLQGCRRSNGDDGAHPDWRMHPADAAGGSASCSGRMRPDWRPHRISLRREPDRTQFISFIANSIRIS